MGLRVLLNLVYYFRPSGSMIEFRLERRDLLGSGKEALKYVLFPITGMAELGNYFFWDRPIYGKCGIFKKKLVERKAAGPLAKAPQKYSESNSGRPAPELLRVSCLRISYMGKNLINLKQLTPTSSDSGQPGLDSQYTWGHFARGPSANHPMDFCGEWPPRPCCYKIF